MTLCPPSVQITRPKSQAGGCLQSGEEQAIGLLFDRYSGLVFSTALKVLMGRADAEGVTQEVFLYLLRCGSNFDPAKGTLVTWILQVATRDRSATGGGQA